MTRVWIEPPFIVWAVSEGSVEYQKAHELTQIGVEQCVDRFCHKTIRIQAPRL